MRRSVVTLFVAGALSLSMSLAACAQQNNAATQDVPAVESESEPQEDGQVAKPASLTTAEPKASAPANAPTTPEEPAPEEPEAEPEADTEEQTVEVNNLILSQYSYAIVDGYVDIVLAITNPNAGWAPELVNVQIVGRAADGGISFADTWQVSTTLPGATTYWAGVVGNGFVQDSDSVEVSLSVNDGFWYETTESANFYQIDNLQTRVDSNGHLVTTGEITLTRDIELAGFGNTHTPMLVVLMRDQYYDLIGGYSAVMGSWLEVGVPTAFEVTSNYENPNSVLIEVTANPW